MESNMDKKIKNFNIISHVDHGKSTLADRLLEITGAVEKRKIRAQFLDMMDLEREKGITIKLQPVRMEHKGYILNLNDTPGHVDFSYEVSRSLAAVEGAVLLVDASQGIQAQTLANLHLAQQQKLKIIAVVNKIDLPQADTEKAAGEIRQLLKNDLAAEPILISAKNSTNVEKVLQEIIDKIPDPQGKQEAPLKALIFDSNYDSYKGVIAYVRLIDGQIEKDKEIYMMASGAKAEVKEVGIFSPQLKPKDSLQAGEIGYIATGLKDISKCRVGDTITLAGQKTAKALPGYQQSKPMVFASFYPVQGNDFDLLKNALEKLKLNDAALQYELESSEALGRGFRCGFLGMLHLEIISERLKREYDLNLVITTPSVSYDMEKMEEPWVKLEIITPNSYLGAVMKLMSNSDAQYQKTDYLNPEKALLEYQAPLREIVIDFYDKLKSITSGYASMAYEPIGYRSADLVKLDVLVAGDKVEAFSKIVPKNKTFQVHN